MAIKKYHVSKNLAQFEKGYINPSNGSESPWTDSSCPIRSQYIECTANSKHVLSSNKYPFQNFVAFYDSGKEFIGRLSGAHVTSARAFTAFENAAFFRVTLWHATESQIYPSEESNLEIMVNKGTTTLPYEPYDPEVWHAISYRKYGTETEAITSLPAQIIGDGQPITSCQISGNMVQNGTPTPSTPIYPEECGERTGNLFDYLTMTNGSSGYLKDDGTINPSESWEITKYIPVSGKSFTLFIDSTGIRPSMCAYDSSKNFITGVSYNNNSIVHISSESNIVYIRFSYLETSESSSFMLNTGSTPLPYEPYGYCITLEVE